MHLRFFSRVQFVVALAITSFLTYAIWSGSFNIDWSLTQPVSSPVKRIIVFGDSFSFERVFSYQNAEDGEHEIVDVVWTEVLRKELEFTDVCSYAQNVNSTDRNGLGVLVNKTIFSSLAAGERALTEQTEDLEQQVERWKANSNKADTRLGSDDHIVAVTAGFWEVWHSSQLTLDEAKSAVILSVQSLFEQLHAVAQSFPEPPTTVIPLLWDASFSPKFASQLQTPGLQARRLKEVQHKLVYLVDYWNMAVLQHAAAWTMGDMYVPPWNIWFLNQIRSAQMTRAGIFDDNDFGGADLPAFKDITDPCSKTVFERIDDSDGSGEFDAMTYTCESPRQHLWWDEIHLGPLAHELLGHAAAELLKSNATANANANANAQPSDTNSTPAAIPAPHLVPSLAPGN